MEQLKRQYPDHRILLSFFSPSGYEIRKNYNGADHVCYLPADTPSNARRWMEVTRPVLAIFIKYEFWLNFSSQLKKNRVPLILVSGIFRPDQVFFRSYGSLFRRILRNFDHFFVQNNTSMELLESIGLKNVTLSGDTRFDRVFQITNVKDTVPVADSFKGNEKVMVIGSCWPEDMDILAPFINETPVKFILAPHDISEGFLSDIEHMLDEKTIRYSRVNSDVDLSDIKVLLVDNIGLLSKLYRYGEFAYVGGAFGKGLHNILEAACYGIPIFFGNQNYEKFREAKDLIMQGGAFEIGSFPELREKYELVNMPENFLLACEVTRTYVLNNLGATEKVMRYCREVLKR